MGLFLMAVLLPFNASSVLMFRELLEVTQLPASELVRHVQQLVEVGILKADVSTNFDQISCTSARNQLKVTRVRL